MGSLGCYSIMGIIWESIDNGKTWISFDHINIRTLFDVEDHWISFDLVDHLDIFPNHTDFLSLFQQPILAELDARFPRPASFWINGTTYSRNRSMLQEGDPC